MPRASLGISGDPGVYWIGVHALGANAVGRDLVADGRARTFIPLVTPERARTSTVPVSVVLPMRERARRARRRQPERPRPMGRPHLARGPADPARRLRCLRRGTPITWVVDPAVLDALDDFGNGNPPLSLAATDVGRRRRATAGRPASPSPSPSTATRAPSADQRARSTTVLETFLGTARTNDLLALGYADPDVAALARRRPSLLTRADVLASRRIEARGLTATPVVAPPTGYFDPTLLPRIPPGDRRCCSATRAR